MNGKKLLLFFHLLSVALSSQVEAGFYNTDFSVNLQVVLVSLEVNKVAHPQGDKDFLEFGYS